MEKKTSKITSKGFGPLSRKCFFFLFSLIRAEIENYYLNNEEAKKNMESVILENFAIKWIINESDATEKDYSFDELVELR